MRRPIALGASALAALLALAGCGSATKTVTVASSPAPVTSTTAATTPPPTTATQTTGTATTTAPAEPATTRTAPEPSFTEGESHTAEGASAAAAVVSSHGFTARDTSEYHPSQTLRVLVGTRTSGTTSEQQAFFFVDGRYLGTDAKNPSGQITVVSQSDTEVAIAYGIYRQGDSSCCPSGGRQVVHFALDDGRLTALEEIPSLSSRT